MSMITVDASGRVSWHKRHYQCALGRGGVSALKQEGDGATPVGEFLLRQVYYRADKVPKPETSLPVVALRPDDGWCDDPADPMYNQFVKLPYAGRHEVLWREDDIYDVVVPLGYNDEPPVPGKGSAIFLHLSRPDYPPTEGCVALALPNLLEILKTVNTKSLICIKE